MSSATNNNPQFLRKYNLVVSSPANSSGPPTTISFNSDGEPYALRLMFSIRTAWFARLWEAEIVIYNPNEQTANFLLTQGNTSGVAPQPSAGQQTLPLQQGMPVTLSAGYQGDGANYGVIWDGYVLQVLWERENQTDFKITLNCIIGLDTLNRSPIIGAYGEALKQSDIVRKMANDCYHPIPIGTISPNLSDKTLPRGKVVFGNPRKYLSEIARDNNAQWWLGPKGALNMGKLTTDIPDSPDLTYTPTTGLIGTPQQTQSGVNFRVLLNANVAVKNPPMVIKLDNTQIRQLMKQVGNLPPSILSQDGTYVVVGVAYHGDTRGQEWYTDVTGMLMGKDLLAALNANLNSYINGG